MLSAAVDSGFSHFDTSPYYGFGLAEQQLGRLPAGDRKKITIATKVGLYGPPGAGADIPSVMSRKILGKIFSSVNRAVVDWSIAKAQGSLENSLRCLQREQVDILYLHEPELTLLNTDEWLRWLESRQQVGMIRHWGVAGEPERIGHFLDAESPLAHIVQVRDSLSKRQADVVQRHGRPMQFTYGYLAGGAQAAAVPAQEILRGAMERNVTGSIIVSTRVIERVSAIAAVAQNI